MEYTSHLEYFMIIYHSVRNYRSCIPWFVVPVWLWPKLIGDSAKEKKICSLQSLCFNAHVYRSVKMLMNVEYVASHSF